MHDILGSNSTSVASLHVCHRTTAIFSFGHGLHILYTPCFDFSVNPFSTWRLHVVWIWWVCTWAARKENPNRYGNPNSHNHCLLTTVSGNAVRVRILICATRQKPQARRYRGAQGALAPPSGNACPPPSPVGEFWYFSSGMAIGHMTMFHSI